MNQREKNIKLFIEYNGNTQTIETFAGEYRNLMVLIKDQLWVEGIGECGGMARCGTCLVELLNADENLAVIDSKEAAVIRRSVNTPATLRLACQILVDETVNGLQVKVLEP
ncbi:MULTISPECIES: 2Fe-2S iron-sulfur cluster-binding family protein [Niastella]|uniref:2Fe-2S iron-sulfur cluster binding domain-containing protein n=1 Tax=Niastella soli TaxID=2821487 RepID=A0ABS3YY88_9BACT|nr:2Fe-2S iron-sulfur cluster-binding protein [Niastella soli]MBO9202894.1 2Fe-2S iron-sulfur cluster binding domain-containing protein [Niastella soli]